MSEQNAPAGLNAPEWTVGLNGLVPLAVLRRPQVLLRPEPGVVRVHLELPAGVELAPRRPITYRIFGGEAGLDFDRNGQIVEVHAAEPPLVLPYRPRIYPTPPPRGQLSLDLSFWYRDAAGVCIQDVQWRQPVVWDRKGTTAIDLRFPAPSAPAGA